MLVLFWMPVGWMMEASCGCLVVFNFNSFGNVAKACSASLVTGIQMLQVNHSPVFWLSPQRARLGAHRSLGQLRPSEGQGWHLCDFRQKQLLCSVMAERILRTDGLPLVSSVPVGSLVIDRL